MINRSPLSIFFSFLLLASLVGCSSPADLFEILRAPFDSQATRMTREAIQLENEGRTIEAILAYRGVLEFEENNLTALTRLADLFANQGRLRSAHRMLHKAASLRPADSAIQTRLAQVQSELIKIVDPRINWVAFLGESVPMGIDFSHTHGFAVLENGVVASLEPASGKQVWKIRLPTRASSAPIHDGTLLFVGGEDGSLYALSMQDGAIRWTYKTRGQIYAPPSISEKLIYCASSDGSLSALTRETGELVWQVRSTGALHASPTLSKGKLFFGSLDARLYALNAETGQPIWQNGFLTQGAVESQPAVVENRVLFGSGDGRVYALAGDSGGEFWRYSTPDSVFASPIIDRERVYIASSGGTLAALDLLTGKPSWELRTEGSIASSPALLNGILFYHSPADPYLYAVQASDGKPLWKVNTGDWLEGNMQVSGQHLILAGKDGTILAFMPQK